MYGSSARWLMRALGWMAGLCGLVLLLWLGSSTLLIVPASAAPARPTQTDSLRDVQTVRHSGAPPPPSKQSSRPASQPAADRKPSPNPGGASSKASAEPARRPAPAQPAGGAPPAPAAPEATSPLRRLGDAVVDKVRQLGGKVLNSGRAVVDRYEQWKHERDDTMQQWRALSPDQKREELHKGIATRKTQELGVATPLAALARVGATYAPQAARAIGKYAPRLAEAGSKVIARAAGHVWNAVTATGRAARDRAIVPAAAAVKNAATTVGRDLGDKITATRDALRHPIRSADTLRSEAAEKVSTAVRDIRNDPKAALKRWPGYVANRSKKFAARTAALGAAEYGIDKVFGDAVPGKGSHSIGAALYAGPGGGATRTRFTDRKGRSMEAITVEAGVGHSISAAERFNGRPPAPGTGLAAGGTAQWHGTGVNVEAKLTPDGGSLSARMQFMGFRGVGAELGCRSWRPSSCSAHLVTPSQFEQELAHVPPHSGSGPSISYKIAATHTVHHPLGWTGQERAPAPTPMLSAGAAGAAARPTPAADAFQPARPRVAPTTPSRARAESAEPRPSASKPAGRSGVESEPRPVQRHKPMAHHRPQATDTAGSQHVQEPRPPKGEPWARRPADQAARPGVQHHRSEGLANRQRMDRGAPAAGVVSDAVPVRCLASVTLRRELSGPGVDTRSPWSHDNGCDSPGHWPAIEPLPRTWAPSINE